MLSAVVVAVVHIRNIIVVPIHAGGCSEFVSCGSIGMYVVVPKVTAAFVEGPSLLS